MRTVYFVTDPLCSWCWGMANDVERVRERLAGKVRFDLLVGGINTDAQTPLAPAMLPRFQAIWTRVAAVTGQRFAMALPADTSFVYNSWTACRAVMAMRRLVERPPFAYLHALQAAFFLEARNTGDAEVLCELAAVEGVAPADLREALAAPDLDEALHQEMRQAKSYGTAALPCILVATERERRLLAGGYADADTTVAMIEDWLARHPPNFD